MANLSDKTSDFADQLQRVAVLAFDVNVDASEDQIHSDLGGVGSFTDQANGQISLDLSGLGDCEKVLEVSVTPSTGTATISGSISSGALTVAIDSNQDLTSVDVDFFVKVIAKRLL